VGGIARDSVADGELPQWTYWYNRWVTYKVVFYDAGKVGEVVASLAIARWGYIRRFAARHADRVGDFTSER
jgi:hypothetical protein